VKRIHVLYLVLASVYVTLATGWIWWWGNVLTFAPFGADYYGFPLPWVAHVWCGGLACGDVTLSLYLEYFPSLLLSFALDMLTYMALGYGLFQVFKRIHQPKRNNENNQSIT
jgi:hypothetical protein